MKPTASEADLFELGKHEELFSNAMKRNWPKVIEKYKNDPTAHTAKISRSGDTALHMAISDLQEDVVVELVAIIISAKAPKPDATATTSKPQNVSPQMAVSPDEREESSEVEKTALGMKNNLKMTPLHLAAYAGSVKMCKCIASQDLRLLGIRNQVEETPMFLAVVHGRKDAFICMHELCQNDVDAYRYCRRTNDGSTILHSAISGEYLDLACYMIHHYPNFQTAVDERGFTPLHLLAGKPSCFKSGRPMNFLHKFIYESIPVKKLKYPDNSKTTLGIPQRLSNITRAPKDQTVQKIDAENPNSQQIVQEKDSVLKGKIRAEKEKHTWSVQIMEQLINFMSEHNYYKYIGSGQISKVGGKEATSPYVVHGHGKVVFKPDMIMAEDIDQIPEPPEPSNATAGNEKKDEASLQLVANKKLEGIEEMVGKIVKKLGADDNDEKKEDKASMENIKKESALLIAAKHGIIEMVEMILDKFPMAIHDENIEGKNIVLLAVENRQPHIYQFLHGRRMLKETIFYKRDIHGNSALHIAAMLGNRKNWLLPGPALQMQWEVKWYQYVETSMPTKFFAPHNDKGESPWDIFCKTHEDLVAQASEWLNKTSQSCSVVAVLIATVAFTTSATVPGGVNSASGRPVLSSQPAFNVFAMASLIALCFSIASVVMFMVFFTSRYREQDFGMDLPTKLLVELTSMLISIAAVLVSFCAGHFFVIQDSFKYTAFSLYVATLFPVAIYAFWQIPVYAEYARATWNKIPQRIYEQYN